MTKLKKMGILLIAVFCIVLSACNNADDTIDASANQNQSYKAVKKIFSTPEEYAGKTISFTGVYQPQGLGEEDVYYCVVTNSSGESYFIDFVWDKNAKDLPEKGEEVKLTGKIAVHTEEDIQSVNIIDVSKVE